MYISSELACQDGDVRLSGGRHNREGRVEICRNKLWGAVCDDWWDENDSAVVCRQLGFSEEGSYIIMQLARSRLSLSSWINSLFTSYSFFL